MKKKILSVGFPSFPLGLSTFQRQLLLAKALLLEGCEVTVLCRYGIYNQSDGVPSKGVFEGVNYTYSSGSAVRPDGYIKRNLLKIWGLINEFNYCRKFSKSGQLAGILVSTTSFHNILFYFFLGKFFGIPVSVDNVEYRTAIGSYSGITQIDKYLYDKYYFLFADNIICISDFLISKVGKSRKERVIKIPVITDFDKFVKSKTENRIVKDKYFLFCGSDFYFEVIDFVISSFEKLHNDNVRLVLVTQPGEKLDHRIKNSKYKDLINVISGLPFKDLINLYMNSEALIIPMRDTEQDKARFPHKISEYCASRRPIITNSIGEISNYFDEKNAFICSHYSEEEYAIAMNKVISDPGLANTIGNNSYETGNKVFNYRSYSKSLLKLFSKG